MPWKNWFHFSGILILWKRKASNNKGIKAQYSFPWFTSCSDLQPGRTHLCVMRWITFPNSRQSSEKAGYWRRQSNGFIWGVTAYMAWLLTAVVCRSWWDDLRQATKVSIYLFFMVYVFCWQRQRAWRRHGNVRELTGPDTVVLCFCRIPLGFFRAYFLYMALYIPKAANEQWSRYQTPIECPMFMTLLEQHHKSNNSEARIANPSSLLGN